MDACVERIGVPLLALAGRNHVDMSVQDQRGGLVVGAPSCHEILPLDRKFVVAVGAVRRDTALDRPQIDIEIPFTEPAEELVLSRVFVASDARGAHELERELVELVPE